MALPLYSNSVLLFPDQFQTLAVFDKKTRKYSPFPMLDKYNPKAHPQYYMLHLKGDVLSIIPVKATSLPSGIAWVECDFQADNDAADIWQEGEAIVIGMGDIRGLNAPMDIRFDLLTHDVFVTALDIFFLRIGKKAKPVSKSRAKAKTKAPVKKVAKGKSKAGLKKKVVKK